MEKLTDLDGLTKEFARAIKSVKNTDETGEPSSEEIQRATIIFIDDTKLFVNEHLNEGFSYDWVSIDGKALFHHDHESNTPNYNYRDLHSIVKGIITFHHLM
ncbi:MULTISPECIES: hypothetical protein [Paenibacillus]|uniref:Uncharacterized protein n=1 Tax=Paenibacillus urinalis TaxID=521520 RepID=A0AAX3N1X2_9BACL|nr:MULTISPECIES: hypothetical protein [Paenibacillus]MCM3128147.1 hypothetical protein [Paenibacillus sp. MER 78]WDH83341.1 hypothetical protein PUW23_03595 [Paenibacillus urinalis]